MKSRKPRDYIPAELVDEARDFIDGISANVEIYRIAVRMGVVGRDIEAERFCSFWILGGYIDNPDALILLKDNKDFIEEQLNDLSVQNAPLYAQRRFACFYRLLNEEGIILIEN